MTSLIDATKPIAGNPTTQSVRDNFAAAKSEIEELQLVHAIRLAHVATTVEIFQQCATDNTLQVVQFNQVTFRNPDDNTRFEFDSGNNEIIIHETGWYNFSVSVHIDRKTTSGADSTWNFWTQLKPPLGSFSDFPDSLRKVTMQASAAVANRFVGFSVISRTTIADSRLRLVQAASDASRQLGVASYPPTGIYPGAPGIIVSLEKIGDL